MFRFQIKILVALWGTMNCAVAAQVKEVPLDQQRWFETRTAHFSIYSCGLAPDVYKLAGRLEQFSKAYSQMAGLQALDSPPIVVIAFPDHESTKPFLPLYQGKPANLAAFFKRGVDENLIVLSLPESNSVVTGMDVIFHEYSHLLLRRNNNIWPLWLKEGMAEIYSTFQTTGKSARIADPIPYHLETLQKNSLMSLSELFAVTHDSPQYNEAERQGVFYAESWLLTHFLMVGDNGQYRTAFSRFNTLMREGQLPAQAFTNALQAPFATVETGLKRYLDASHFSPINLALASDISAPISLATRSLAPVEIAFRLGDELLRIDRLDAAENYFVQAQKIAPTSPLPEEGLGLLANQREQHKMALQHLQAAIQRGSTSFLIYYLCADENYTATADAKDLYKPIKKMRAQEIRWELERSLALMPDFGPAQELAGFFEMVQGEHLLNARQHLQRAIQLEPENLSYQFTLAQFQYQTRNLEAARQTLQPLLLLNVDAKLRSDAQELMKQINRGRTTH